MPKEYVVDDAAVEYYHLESGNGNPIRVKVLLDDSDAGGPEATRAYQPNSNVKPHFHLAAQFQLVTQGTVKFPTETLSGIAVHYTDHAVPYGPFTTTPDYHMYVVHAKPGGQIFMTEPEAREKVNRTGREIAACEADVAWEAMPGHAGARRKVLFREATGLGAEIIECPPGMDLRTGGSRYGRYDIVVKGSASVEGKPISQYGLRFVSGDGAPAAMRAGAEGATVVLLEYDQDAEGFHGGKFLDRIHQMQRELKAKQAAGTKGMAPKAASAKG